MSAAEVLSLLRASGRTLAVAESLTGGLLTDAFVQVPGASAVLLGGIISYATELKYEVLGVDRALLETEGPVHPEVARQMADGVRRALAVGGRIADVGIATTGVAGPDQQGGRRPGTVYIGVAIGSCPVATSGALSGDRAAVRAAAVRLALDTLEARLRTE